MQMRNQNQNPAALFGNMQLSNSQGPAGVNNSILSFEMGNQNASAENIGRLRSSQFGLNNELRDSNIPDMSILIAAKNQTR